MRHGAHTLPNATFDARRRGVLAVTCAVHLLALFLWTQERRVLPLRPPRAVTILLQTERAQPARPPLDADVHLLPEPSLPAPPSIAAPALQPEPVHRADDDDIQHATRRGPHADVPVDVPADAVPAAAPSTPDALAPNPIDTAQPVAPNMDARAGARPAQGGFVAGLAKQQAGRIDRELRKGKPGVPTEADTPAARFQRGVEAAYIDRTLTWQSDTYTSPDGVVIYRFRQGNRVRCRRAGGVGMPLAGMPGTGSITAASAGAAGATACPKGVVWNQD
ncbi:hypothetical protein GPY61_20385 [Massilia sp. NEAU-DD11]|jgi:hypothetical protein|uniref:Uncharacterized protein n=1 Tax=Massilia cellulosiltytica TaxID=2683234 RepID=A0A7X3K8T6_9BURK|nr:hypothetical protein [Telluria cellulosilytica]MVW62298.1 hypothetical protein [Telluria cellulosilytica]